MPVQTKNQSPYFDTEPYQHECNECGKVVNIWKAEVEESMKADFLVLTTRCIIGCGREFVFSNPITEHEKDMLQTNFRSSTFRPWEYKVDRGGLYSQEEIEMIESDILNNNE